MVMDRDLILHENDISLHGISDVLQGEQEKPHGCQSPNTALKNNPIISRQCSKVMPERGVIWEMFFSLEK